MLSGMRAFAKSRWAIVLLALLALAMAVGVGISNPFTGVSGGGFIGAGDHRFAVRDANRLVNRQVERVRNETGEVLTNEQIAARNIPSLVLNDLAQKAILLAYSDKLDIKASPTAVSGLLADAPRFKDALGRFDMQQVEAFAAELGYVANDRSGDIRALEANMRDDFTMQYVEAAAFSGFTLPEVFVDPLVGYLGERRRISFARLTPDSISEPAEPTEEQLATFYEQRKGMFAEPERRSITVISYSPTDFEDLTVVSDEDIKKDYQRRLREFSQSETRTIVEFQAPDQNAIQSIIDLLKQDVPLETAIAQTPGVQSETRTVQQADISEKEYRDLVFSMSEGAAVGPLPGEGKSRGVVVTAITLTGTLPLEDVEDRIRSDLSAGPATRLFRASEETFYDLVGAGEQLETIAKEIGAPILAIEAIDQSLRTRGHGGAALKGLNADVAAEVFELQVGETTDIHEVDGGRIVARLDAITEARQPPIDEVKEQLVGLYKANAQAEAADKLMADATARIVAGEDFEAVAKSAKLITLQNGELYDRPFNQQTRDPVIETAFTGALNTPIVARNGSGVPFIVRTEEILPPDAERIDAIKTAIKSQVEQSVYGDVRQAFLQGVQEQVKLNTNENAIKSYLDSFSKPAE